MIPALVIFVFFTWYLVSQAVEDVKTQEVYVWKNNLALCVGVVVSSYYAIKGNRFPLEELLVVLFFLAMSTFGMYGQGDVKAMIAMYLSTPVYDFFNGYPNTVCFLFGLLTGEVACLIYWRVFRKIPMKERVPYFPFLWFGYLITVVTIL